MMEGLDVDDNVPELHEEYQIKEEPDFDEHGCAVNNLEQLRSETLLSEPSVSNSSELLSISKTFNYQKQCVICGNDTSKQVMQSPKSLWLDKLVYLVSERKTLETLYLASLDYDGDIDIEAVRERLNKDLVALNARYHKSCYMKLVQPHNHTEGSGKRGQSPSVAELAQMRSVYEYIEKNLDDSQFSLEDIRKYTNVTLDDETLRSQLSEHYNIAFVGEKDFVINQNELTLNDWYNQKLSDEKNERARIVSAAANIILEDIRSVPFDNEYYPPPSAFLDDVASMIPETLRTFIETIVTKYNDNPAGLDPAVAAVTHAIMTAARPRTFKSPLLLGIGSYIHQKYASKSFINLLSSIGFCASYSDVMKFEMSLAYHDKPESEATFTQFVYDSLVAQTEGYSGPALVGVQCDTPKTPDAPVPRLHTAPTGAAAMSRDAAITQMFVDPTTGLRNVLIEDHNDDTAVLPTKGDALWLFGKNDPILKNELPAWDKFMAKAQKNKTMPVSDIRALPVIYFPPRNGSVYTALRQAQRRCEILHVATCIVTFDQPLYQMAQRIVKSDTMNELSNIVLRLGTFHLMTSFLGTIGRIMSGSGLRELWCSVFPAELVAAMMAGRAYSAAMRAHLLTRSALFGIITKDFDLTADERLEIEGIIDGGIFDIPKTDSQGVKKYQDPLAITLELLEARGPTAKLWVQYFRMSTLAARLVEAERGADWELHLSTLRKMLPYFHAGGNFEYAKSCSLYLQEMRVLETKMSAEEYEAFTKKGYFTIRKTDKVWADVWSDRMAELTMKDIIKRPTEAIGGGRVTDNVSARWSSAGPLLSTVSDLIEGFCSPEGKASTDESRRKKDDEHIKKIYCWFKEYNPFVNTEGIVSLGTGILERGHINCHKAEEVGKRIMAEKVGQNYKDVEYQRDKCVRPLSSVKSTIQIDNFENPMEPDTILRRIKTMRKQVDRLFTSNFECELAPYPLSLFDEHGMLEANKSALFELFIPVEIAEEGKRSYVIDGEFLLHKVTWKEDEPILSIINTYTEYVKMQFPNAVVVFGNENGKGITMMNRRKIKTNTSTMKLQKNTVIRTTQENFLSNEKNKEKLIQYLIIDFTRSGINVKLSPDDVHSDIVKTAVDHSAMFDQTCVVSDDVDLLVVMCARTDHKNIYFMKPKSRDKPATYYHVHSFRSIKIQYAILFIHAISGCDTTSAIFRKGKAVVASAIESWPISVITDLMTQFKNPVADPTELAEYGDSFMRHLYGLFISNLTERRYRMFIDTWTRSRWDLARLPPSENACKQHVFRAYHQVQKWLGNDLPATDWGWELVGDHLEPVMISGEVAPEEILDMVACRCRSLCGSSCPCKQGRVDCCELCLDCRGNACHGVDKDADFEPGFEALSGCDKYGNPIDYDIDSDDDDDAITKADESSVGPSSPKRLRRDSAQ